MSPLQEAIEAVMAHQWHGPREQLAALERLIVEARSVAQPAEPVAELDALRADRDALARALNTAEANLRYWRESRGAFTPSDTELSDTLRRIEAARTGGGKP